MEDEHDGKDPIIQQFFLPHSTPRADVYIQAKDQAFVSAIQSKEDINKSIF
jgi:hypothetical protein